MVRMHLAMLLGHMVVLEEGFEEIAEVLLHLLGWRVYPSLLIKD